MLGFLIFLAAAVTIVVITLVADSYSEINGDAPEGYEGTTADEGLQLAADNFYSSQSDLFVDLPDQNQDPSKGLLVKFLGTNSLYISDNETKLLIDPFFTRPKLGNYGRWHGNNRIPSSESAVEYTLKAAGLYNKKIHAILVTHTHYDHAMDIAWVWKMTGKPLIVGSESMKNVLMWHKNDSDEFKELTNRFRLANINVTNDPMSWNKFTPESSKFKVSFIQSYHIELISSGVPLPGSTKVGVSLPAHVQDYKCGLVSSLFIEHSEHGSIYNQGSAGYRQSWVPSAIKADYLIPGVAGRDSFVFRGNSVGFAQDMLKLKPSRILFSHWDNFDKPIWSSPGWITECWKTREAFNQELFYQGYEKGEIDARFLRIFGDVYLVKT